MDTYKRLPLRLESHKRLYYNQLSLQKYIKRIENLLEEMPSMNTLEFARSSLEYKELKANNNIEGIKDDIEEIERVIRNEKDIPWENKERIINLNRGYRYILSNNDISKENLKELYSILSKGLLSESAQKNMGDYYRNGPVYILNGGLMLNFIKTLPAEKVNEYMEKLLDYINNYEVKTDIDNFIKSQVIHFYFVYIHPYFDVNGRTARTVSMWELINTKTYPYIIFNRAISLNKREYIYKLNEARKKGNITPFIKYMLKIVSNEFEKEIIIKNIKDNSNKEITIEETQMLEYLLTLKEDITALDVIDKYNIFNMYKQPEILFQDYIYPLIEKGILINCGNTKYKITRDMPNIKIAINNDLLDIDSEKIKSMNLKKYLSKQL